MPLLALMLALTWIPAGCSTTGWLDSDGAVVATSFTDGSGKTYAIVDTGQNLTYDDAGMLAVAPSEGKAYYGQDAQYDGDAPAYVDNGDGTVADLDTGLMWQQGFSGKMAYEEAVAAAEMFELAGYTDWRLPTIKELYSLIDFSGLDLMSEFDQQIPFIDTAYFEFEYGETGTGERIIDSQWPTSTLYVGGDDVTGGDQMFGVNFADGRIKGYGLSDPQGGEKTFFVRFVRGNPTTARMTPFPSAKALLSARNPVVYRFR